MVWRDSLIAAGTPAEKGKPMAALYGFRDRGGKRHAIARMDNGDAVYIAVADSGVSVRSSRFGFLGCRLYQADTLEEARATARRLEPMCNGHLTPPGMEDPLLLTFTRAVLRCSNASEVSELLNGEPEPAELEHVLMAGPAGSEGLA
jgi:hypothetical protein